MSTNAKHRRRTKRKLRRTRNVPALIIYVHGTHDPYDNSIGGPNDYAYGM